MTDNDTELDLIWGVEAIATEIVRTFSELVSTSRSRLVARGQTPRCSPHHAVHSVPLARLVFVPEHDGRLHRCAIHAIEAGHNVTSCGEKLEGGHGRISMREAAA